MKPSQTQFSVLLLNVQGIRNTKNRKTIFTWLKDHNVHNSITFLQECHSDVQTQAKWSQDWPGTTYFSHDTTHSCGVITHVGKNLEFSYLTNLNAYGGRGTFKRKSLNKIESIIYENDLCDIWRLKNENLCQFT